MITTNNPTMRTLLIVLAGIAGILVFAIYVAANSPSRFRAEADLAEAKSLAEEARNDAAQRIDALEQENADFRKRLELAKADLDQRAEKLAATEEEVTRFRGELDVALKKLAELTQKYADAVEAERKARLDADAARRVARTVVQRPAEIDAARGGNQNRGQNIDPNNNFGAKKRRGRLPRCPGPPQASASWTRTTMAGCRWPSSKPAFRTCPTRKSDSKRSTLTAMAR